MLRLGDGRHANIEVPSYTLLNANISDVRDSGFNAQLNIDNVLDEFYAAGAYTDMFVNYGRPRTVRLI